jgi:hypothetical protein
MTTMHGDICTCAVCRPHLVKTARPPASPVAPAPQPGMTVDGWGLPHEANWDGYGALPISVDVERNARKLWNVLHSNPEPTPNGTLSFESESGTIEIGKTRISGYFGDDTHRIFLDGTLGVAPVATGETALSLIIRKCEQYWNEPNIGDAEIHAILENIHRWAREAAQPAGTPDTPTGLQVASAMYKTIKELGDGKYINEKTGEPIPGRCKPEKWYARIAEYLRAAQPAGTPEQVRELVAKWRDKAVRWSLAGPTANSQTVDALRYCANELESALTQQQPSGQDASPLDKSPK